MQYMILNSFAIKEIIGTNDKNTSVRFVDDDNNCSMLVSQFWWFPVLCYKIVWFSVRHSRVLRDAFFFKSEKKYERERKQNKWNKI